VLRSQRSASGAPLFLPASTCRVRPHAISSPSTGPGRALPAKCARPSQWLSVLDTGEQNPSFCLAEPNPDPPCRHIGEDTFKLPAARIAGCRPFAHSCDAADCAWIYGNEKEAGDGIKDSGIEREKLWLTSKVRSGARCFVFEGWKRALMPRA
jgi:hypothetical protein